MMLSSRGIETRLLPNILSDSCKNLVHQIQFYSFPSCIKKGPAQIANYKAYLYSEANKSRIHYHSNFLLEVNLTHQSLVIFVCLFYCVPFLLPFFPVFPCLQWQHFQHCVVIDSRIHQEEDDEYDEETNEVVAIGQKRRGEIAFVQISIGCTGAAPVS